MWSLRLSQRLCNMGKMQAHGRLRTVRIMICDSLNDVTMLLMRTPWSSRDEDSTILKAHVLGFEHIEQAGRGSMMGNLQQRPVESSIDFRGGEQVAFFDVALLLGEQRVQNITIRRCGIQGCIPGRQAFQGSAYFEDLNRFGLGDEANACASIAFSLH